MAPVMNSLHVACETLLASEEQIKPENCVELWSNAQKYGCFDLMHATSTFIAKYLADLASNDDFLRLSAADFARLLLSEPVRTADPDHRCHAALSWLNYDRIGRAQFVKDIVGMVPLTYGLVSASTLYEAHESEMLREHAPDTIGNLTSDIFKRMTSTTSGCFSGGSCYPNWYVVGNNDLLEQQKLFMYDASRRLWSELSDLPWDRAGAGVTITGNRLTVLGGRKNEQITDDIDEYNLPTRSWTTISTKLSVARSFLTACRVGQQTFVIGGSDQNDEVQDIVEQYDAKSKRIMCVAPMGSKRCDLLASASGANNDCVFVAGGSGEGCGNIEKYDVRANTWVNVGHMEQRAALACTLSGDDLYLAGGFDPYVGTPEDTLQIFNVRTGQIRVAQNGLPHARSDAHATTLFNGSVVCLVGGSWSVDGELPRGVLCLNTRENKWSTGTIVPDMPEGDHLFGFAAL